MGWTRTGELIVYTEGAGTSGIWSIPMDDGRPVGEPVLLKGDVWGLEPLGSSSDAFFYLQAVDAPKIYAATIDIERGGFVVAPTAVMSAAGGAATTVQWSPDGRSFVYARRTMPNERRYDLVLQSWDGRDVRVLTTLAEAVWHLLWHPDGQSVLFTAGAPRTLTLHRLDIRTGETMVLREFDRFTSFTLSSDGRSLITISGGSGEPHTVAAIDLESGEERTLASIPRSDWFFSAPALSPDGRSVALSGGVRFDAGPSGLFIVPVEGGETRQILAVEDAAKLRGTPAWSPDGESVLASLGGSLIAVPAAGGPHRVVLDEMTQRPWSLHPDGRRILFVDGRWVRELWAMEQVPSVR
jgi:Tol biopolymer transport system component